MTCTERLQQCNKPKSRQPEAIPVNELSSRRLQILKKDAKESAANYDPRPLPLCSVEIATLEEQMRTDLANGLGNSVFLQILVPPLSVALHDHNHYARSLESSVSIPKQHLLE